MPISLNNYAKFSSYSSFVLIAIAALLLALGSNIGVRACLSVAGISGALLCFWSWLANNKPSLPAVLLLPVLFILYVLISPGTPFTDARIAGRLACALFAGISAQFFFRKYIDKTLLLFNIALSLSVVLGGLYAFFFAPELIAGRWALNFGNPHPLAFTAATAVFITLAYSPTLPKKLKMLSYATTVIALVAIALTVSRSTYIGLILACGVYILVYHAKQFFKVALVGIVLCIALFPLLPESQQQRIQTALTAPLEDGNVRLRLGIWYTALEGFKESPILGNGLRSYTDYDQKYKNAHSNEMKKVPHLLLQDERWAHPHSLYLAALFGWGIVGTLLFIAAYIPALRQAKGRSKRFLILMVLFNLGYGLTDLRIKSHDGAFFLFFPLGLAYGSVLLEYYRAKDITLSPDITLAETFKRLKLSSSTSKTT